MKADSTFVLDANVFIEAARRYYAFDLAPRFWTSLAQLASEGRILSVDRVKKELKWPNELVTWAHRNSGLFASTSQSDVIQHFGNIMRWVNVQSQFSDAARTEFMDVADGWLIAFAIAKGFTVVTHEIYNPTSRKKIPIPNVCRAFGIQPVDTFEMLRSLGIRFN